MNSDYHLSVCIDAFEVLWVDCDCQAKRGLGKEAIVTRRYEVGSSTN